MFMAKKIELEFDRNATPTYVQADRLKFKQVIINLVSNAIKYNVDGGRVLITVESSCEDACIDDPVRISVTDTGPGLKPEQIGMLFEPFQRLGAEATSIQGTGLGLVLTKNLVEAMGGDVRVKSEPGVGSTFMVCLQKTRED